MSIFESGESPILWHFTGLNSFVELPEYLQEGIRVSLGMSSREASKRARSIMEKGWILNK